MGISKITRNYQITLPKDIRTLMGIERGDRVLMNLDDKGRVVIDILRKSPVDETFGTWKGEVEGVSYVERIRKGWKARSEELDID